MNEVQEESGLAPEAVQVPAQPPFLNIMVAGDLVLVKNQDPVMQKRSLKYQELFELYANMGKAERLVTYTMTSALMLTGLARRTADADTRKAIFDKKNLLLVNLLEQHELRRLCGMKYLKSRNFKVTKYCENCEKANLEAALPRFKWKFCKQCSVDRSYYNVVSVHHRFPDGFLTVYLGQQALGMVKGLKIKAVDQLEKFEEEGRFKRYLYEPKSFSVFKEEGIEKLFNMLKTKVPAFIS